MSQVEELMKENFVNKSISPCVVPALRTSKKNETWCMFVDSRATNKIMVKYCFSIPKLDSMLNMMSSITIFSKKDLKSDYRQIRVCPANERKTAFKTNDGLYEWIVMPLALTNTISTLVSDNSSIVFYGKFLIV